MKAKALQRPKIVVTIKLTLTETVVNQKQKDKLDTIMSESDLLDDDASVEFEGEGFKIVFGAISDWYNKSVTLAYEGKCSDKEMMCLMYELAIWCETDRKERSKISDVIAQYDGHLPQPTLSIKTHVVSD